MRKILISLLLAGAAASPAFAGPNGQSDRQQVREERQQAHEEHVQARENARADRSANGSSLDARQFQPQAQAPRQSFDNRPQFNGARGQAPVNVDAMRAQRDPYAAERNAYAAERDAYAGERNAYAAQRGEQARQQFEQRQQQMEGARELRQSNRAGPNVIRDRRPPVVSNTPRFGTQPPLRQESRVQWNTNWRNNGHYDWRNYRNHHRSRFHLGFYYDPFGWGYQPFSIGWRLWPAYYGNQFWINDPAMYDLPFPPPGAVWVRYWNDAMLVDTFTGTVIDVIPGFFW
jgi:Ni/Co efflux regulator RcnB